MNAGQGCSKEGCVDPRVRAIRTIDLNGLGGGRLRFDDNGVAQREQFLIRVRDGIWRSCRIRLITSVLVVSGNLLIFLLD